ncbi:hypothetical protein C8R45DRAFT_1034212 [Mycena sanguinolenta]|nr:hypothetical protein C8R45DRAFT_1034212 [Mycena sanguinolenta]
MGWVPACLATLATNPQMLMLTYANARWHSIAAGLAVGERSNSEQSWNERTRWRGGENANLLERRQQGPGPGRLGSFPSLLALIRTYSLRVCLIIRALLLVPPNFPGARELHDLIHLDSGVDYLGRSASSIASLSAINSIAQMHCAPTNNRINPSFRSSLSRIPTTYSFTVGERGSFPDPACPHMFKLRGTRSGKCFGFGFGAPIEDVYGKLQYLLTSSPFLATRNRFFSNTHDVNLKTASSSTFLPSSCQVFFYFQLNLLQVPSFLPQPTLAGRYVGRPLHLFESRTRTRTWSAFSINPS